MTPLSSLQRDGGASPKRNRTLRWLKGVLITLIVFAVGLQIIAASLNIYFDKDEVRKLMRTSGVTVPKLTAVLTLAEPMPISEFVDRYQLTCTQCEQAPGLNALLANREHPPLYYFLLQKWMGLFATWLNPKLFATLLTIATLPALYWLSYELFRDRLAALISLSLFSVSPLIFSASQHVSQYSLLILLSCLSTATFIRTYRTPSKQMWALYSLLIGLGFYTHLFFVLLPVAHLAYALAQKNLSKIRGAVLAVVTAGLSFVPWIAGILSGYQQFALTTNLADPPEVTAPPPLWSYFTNGIMLSVQLFLKKSNISLLSNDWLDNPGVAILAMITAITTIVWLVHHRKEKDSFALILSCLTLTSLPIIVLDTFLVQGISAKVRYYLPTVMAGLPLLGYWLALGVRSTPKKTALPRPRTWQRRAFSIGLLFVLLVSLTSTANLFRITLSTTASGAQYGRNYQRAATVINQVSAETLVISYEDYIQTLVFSHRLNKDTDYLFRDEQTLSSQSLSREIQKYRSEYTNIFVFSPANSRIELFEEAGIAYEKIPAEWNSPMLYKVSG